MRWRAEGLPCLQYPKVAPPTGRPSQVLDDARCEAIWNITEREGDALLAEKAAPFITNFHLVDTNGDHNVSLEEFKAGCSKGLVEKRSGSPLPTKKASPDVPKE